jgi:hypothetical protein
MSVVLLLAIAVAGCGSTGASTTSSALAPTTITSETSTTAAVAPGAKTWSDGTYQVGTDIPAGLYKSTKVGDNASWHTASDATGSADSIIANVSVTGQCYIEVSNGQYLTLALLTIAPADAVKSASVGSQNITDGNYLVGTDIAPGKYKGTVWGDRAYWQIATSADGEPEHIVSNDIPFAPFDVEVTEGQFLTIRGVSISLAQ